MPLPKISEARELSDEKLVEEIVAVKRQLFQLRLQKATRQLDKPHQFRHAPPSPSPVADGRGRTSTSSKSIG